MRVAGHTYAFRVLPLAEALDRRAAIGFTDVELWLGHGNDGPEKAAATVERSGLRVRGVSAGGFYRADDDTPRRAVELAQALGAETVVTCVRPQLVSDLARIVPAELTIAVENHWDQPLDTSRRVLSALDRAPNLRACLDTGHALMAGERPDRAIGTLGDRLAHVHLKDGASRTGLQRLLGPKLRKKLQGKPAPVFPGDGDLRIREVHEQLDRIGFDGWVSLEHEGSDVERALSILRQTWLELQG
jgi:sugar phosphate isomerase/epimerase